MPHPRLLCGAILAVSLVLGAARGEDEAHRFKQGLDALDRKDFDAAARHFQAGLNTEPDYEPLWTRNNLGYALHMLGRYDEAAKEYAAALALPAKRDPKLYINAVKNHLAAQHPAEAHAVAKKGFTEFPKDESLESCLHFAAGLLAIETEDWAAGEREFVWLQNERPDFDPMWVGNNLGFTLYRRERHINAALVFDAALGRPLEIPPWKLFCNAALNAVAMKDLKKARTIIRRGTIEHPKEAAVWDMAGWIEHLNENKDASQKAYDTAQSLAAETSRPATTELRLPFTIRALVAQGNGGQFSHRSLNARFAWDFQIVNADGKTFTGRGKKNEDYLGFGLPVIAAAAGKVVAIRQSVADNIPGAVDPTKAEGNFVVIEHPNGERAQYLHLKQNSVAVKPGDRVTAGQKIGDCGNSGFSTSPHLHFGMILGRRNETSLPAQFREYRIYTSVGAVPVKSGAPEQGQIVEPSSR